ncbi:MAG: hypothetical protein IJO65_12235 [Lachnospiraceae bacterium]|nr:hypothetical protein [Lachnospiraceae bacterium]
MRNKLYYPYINIKDEDFLKYAILYYDKLHLIVPESIRFNEKMSRVAESTDLFVKIKPEQSYQTCCDATKYTIAFIDERMRTDSNFDVYRNEHTSRLYKGKYNWEFSEYCEKNELLTLQRDSIKVHPVIASEYMTNLANLIAGKNGMDIVTDTVKYADYHFNPDFRGMKNSIIRDEVMRRELAFVLPVDMRGIPIEKIIDFRNHNEYAAMRQAFHRYTEKCMESTIQNDFDLVEYMRLKKDFVEFFKSYSLEIADFSMSFVMFASGCEFLGVTAFAAGAISMIHDFKDIITDLKSGNLTKISDSIAARRYLGKIKQMPFINY